MILNMFFFRSRGSENIWHFGSKHWKRKKSRQILLKCCKILEEHDMRFFMSDQESNLYLKTVEKLLDNADLLLKKVIE